VVFDLPEQLGVAEPHVVTSVEIVSLAQELYDI